MKYDIFLSYKSEDHPWVENLKDSLQKRGVSVWLDKDAIRPGDLFAQALENGINNSRAVAIIVTPKSMKSKWVQEEYYRALSLANNSKINIIPCILKQTDIPGFLSSRQYIDFTDESRFERNVDKLVFPGITGKEIYVESFTWDRSGAGWDDLENAFLNVLGIRSITGSSPSRMIGWTYEKKHPDSNSKPISFASDKNYTVYVIDMTFHGVKESAEFILEHRNSKERVYNSAVFVFYHPPNFFNSPNLEISDDLKTRFSHYYVIEKNQETIELERSVRNTWNAVMQDLIRYERTTKFGG